MKRALVAVAAALALAACSHPGTGRVIDKHISPAYSMPQCNLVGKVMVCTPIFFSERWVLTLKNDTDQWDVDVSQPVYDATNIGDTARTDQP